MSKKLCIICLAIPLLFTGCNSDTATTSSTSSISSTETSHTSDENTGSSQSRLSIGEPLTWGTELETASLEAKATDWNSFDLPEDRDLWEMGIVGDKVILSLLIPPENADAQMSTQTEYVALDAATNESTSLGTFSHHSEGIDSSFSVADRYYVIAMASYEEEVMHGYILIYDAQTNTMKTADSYAVETYGYKQFAGAVGETGVAYWYEEAGTGEIVVRYYDFATGTAKEIWRQEPTESDGFAPMAIAGSDTGIALLMQKSMEKLSAECPTHLLWIGTDGSLLKKEDLPIEDVGGRTSYTIESFSITGDCYSITTKNNNTVLLFKREGDTLRPLSMKEPLPQRQYELAKENRLYFSTLPQSGAMLSAVQLDLTAETITHYNVNGTAGDRNYIEYFGNDAVFIVCTNPGEFSVGTSSYYYKKLS